MSQSGRQRKIYNAPTSAEGASDSDVEAFIGRIRPSGEADSDSDTAPSRPRVTLTIDELRKPFPGLAAVYDAVHHDLTSVPAPRGCRGTRQLGKPSRQAAPRNCATLDCDADCDCPDCPECQRKSRHRHRGHRGQTGVSHRHPSLRPPSAVGHPLGPIGPTPAYLKGAAVPSVAQAIGNPLVVISIEGVVCAHLPPHLSGGHTDVLSRPYLHTLMDYLLHPSCHWVIAFWSGTMNRKEALQTLKWLGLPTGSAEKNERDGVVGVWSKEDMAAGWDGGELAVMDLQLMWDELKIEEGVTWSLENTVLITAFPEYARAQPHNFILAPEDRYLESSPSWEDQFLLIMIAILEDLATESNFAQHCDALALNTEAVWTGEDPDDVHRRDECIRNAVRICAQRFIVIKASGGN